MGSVTRRTLASLLVAVPAVAATVAVSGTSATALPFAPVQAGDAKVATTADFKFDPAEITVAAGGRVTWTNTDGGYHTVSGGDRAKDPSSPIQGVIAARGNTYSATFANPGTYKYFCEPHAAMGMVGTVIVTAGAGAPASATAPATTAPAPAGSSAPPASASASANVGAPQQGAGAPTNDPDTHEGEEGGHEEAPGVEGNKTLEAIEAERASMKGAVSGFRFFAVVATAFLFILGAAVLFSTRPRRAGK